MRERVNREVWKARYWVILAGVFVTCHLWVGLTVLESGVLSYAVLAVIAIYRIDALHEKPFVREMTVQVPSVTLDDDSRELLERICEHIEKDKDGGCGGGF